MRAEKTLVRRSITPVSSRGGEGGIVEHVGAEASETFVNSGFDLGEGGFGMLKAPFVYTTENIGAQAAPVLIEVVPAHIASLIEVRPLSYAVTSAPAILLANLLRTPVTTILLLLSSENVTLTAQ